MNLSAHNYFAISFAILFMYCIPAIAQNQEDINHLFREDDPSYKIEREQWMNEMHRCEPGVNHELINYEIRASRARDRSVALESALRSGSFPKSSDELPVGGYLHGQWIEKGSQNQSGRTHIGDIDFDRNLIYLASSGGNVWRGTLEGEDWTCLNNGRKFPNIRMVRIMKHEGSNRVIIATNSPSAVYYSDNEGLSWERAEGLENPARWGGVRRAIITNDPEPEMYVLFNEWDYVDWGSRAGLYRSTDMGETFEHLARWRYDNTGSGHFDIWTPRYDRSEVFIAHVDTISEVQDDGTIVPVGLIETPRDYTSLKNVFLQGFYREDKYEFFLFMNISGSLTEFYASTDEAATWKYRGEVTFGPFQDNSFTVSTLDPDNMFCGGVECFRSHDGGVTWTRVNKWGAYYGNPADLLHADIPGITCFRLPEGGEITHVATDGGSYLSTDYLRTVKNISLDGLNVSQYYTVYTNRDNMTFIYAGAQDQGFQRTDSDTGGTAYFKQLISGDYGHLTSSNNGKMLWTVYPGFAMVYLNSIAASPARKTWNFVGNRLWLPPILADPRDPAVAYAAVGGTGVEAKITKLTYTPDSSKVIAEVLPFDFSLGESGRKISSLAISETDPDRWYVLTNKGMFFTSSDNGVSWTENDEFTAMGGHYFYGSNILPSKLEPGKLVIAGSGYSNPGAYVSMDHGATFAPMDSSLPNTLVYDISMSDDEEFIFAATSVGPYVYIAAQGEWFDLADLDTPDQTYWCIDYIDEIKTARFATYGRGIWDFKISEIVGTKPNPAFVASEPRLDSYPNPTRSGTTFDFTIPGGASASLRIYDMLGRVVYETTPGALQEGTNSIHWNALSDGGASLGAGSYLAVLAYNGQAAYQKIILTD
jgi:flagellar hook capping protein FlgD